VDLPPQALLNRLQRGVIYEPRKAKQAMEHFFKEHTLAALREMAIRQAAHEVAVRQVDTQMAHVTFPVTESERILIHVSDSPSAAALIRRGRRVADYLRADCFAVCISPSADLSQIPRPERDAIEKHLEFARRLHIETRILEGHNPAETLVEFARRNGVTQIFLNKPIKRRLSFLPLREFVMKVVRLASDMQVTVVAERRRLAGP
jgi:two-component system sensor histidine kinase KdpD